MVASEEVEAAVVVVVASEEVEAAAVVVAVASEAAGAEAVEVADFRKDFSSTLNYWTGTFSLNSFFYAHRLSADRYNIKY